ncbi:hypothetical protein OE88DRAFT_1730306 [Heliocybe sulcata]|uniref:Uncharacterized protein n=1 Tax=Heliocybe sulcata TaxID=5364 RepID=A0A5C3NIY8_9AGAM|nr:hypothetical protein OE88DRAFT_1730306 [Heliocybe sulcata]
MSSPCNVSNGPTRVISVLAIVLSCVGILLSMIVYWTTRIIPALKMKMPASADRSSCPNGSTKFSPPVSDMTHSASRSPKRVSFSLEDENDADVSVNSATSPRSSFSSERSTDSSFSSESRRSSQFDPFRASSSAASTLAGFFSSDKPSPIRIPNILKAKRIRSGSGSSASSAPPVSPTPAQRTVSTASASPVRLSEELKARPSATPRMSWRSLSRHSIMKEDVKATPRSMRSQSIRGERVSKLKRVSEESGELYYSGWENPFKSGKGSLSRAGSSCKKLGQRVHSIFSVSSNDTQSTASSTASYFDTSITSDGASSAAASLDTPRTRSRRSRMKSFTQKFVPLSRTSSRGSQES